MIRSCFGPLLPALILGTSLGAQTLPFVQPFQALGVESYRESVPSPQSVLGHNVGERHTEPHLIVEYFRSVAAVSDRVLLEHHGTTHQARPLIHAVITSPENHSRLEDIRRANLRLSERPDSVSEAELERIPGVIWMGYGVHGNEASSFEAAMLLLYHLAAGEGREVESLLREQVVILIPSLNPDGHARHVQWVNGNRGQVATADPQHREHNEPWPGGRTNHYWFDLNRDWFPLQHPESQGRIELYYHWRPQLVTDFHEMGSQDTYFFQPGVPTRNHPLIPERVVELTRRIGEFHQRALDTIGSLYFQQEGYDDFYIGKGSTYPDVTGAVGILFEQASSRALRRETSRGVLEFPFTIRNHFVTSLSTLEAARQMRLDLLRHQRDFYIEAQRVASEWPVKAYLISIHPDPTRARKLVQLLLQHRIRVHRLVRRAQFENLVFEPGEAFVVPLDQPQARLLEALMERRTEFEDREFYDISAWSLALSFGARYAELIENASAFLGDVVQRLPLDPGAVEGGMARYAYLLEWNSYDAPRALYRLQSEGALTLIAKAPFLARTQVGERSFEAGTIVIPVAQPSLSPQRLHRLVEETARQDSVRFFSTDTGATLDGPDLGSRRMAVLAPPRIALLSGAGTTAGEVGEAWHLLDKRMGIPVTLLDVQAAARADLSRYDTIVMVHGSYADLSSGFVSSLKSWIQAGGRLIAIKGGAAWALRNEVVAEQLRETEPRSFDVPYAELSSARAHERISGAVFRARLDTTHPLAFGCDSEIALFRNSEIFFEPSKNDGVTVGRYSEAPLLAGHVSENRLQELSGSAALLARSEGQGSVILFADNPNFRAIWLGTHRLFLNAVFLGGAF